MGVECDGQWVAPMCRWKDEFPCLSAVDFGGRCLSRGVDQKAECYLWLPAAVDREEAPGRRIGAVRAAVPMAGGVAVDREQSL